MTALALIRNPPVGKRNCTYERARSENRSMPVYGRLGKPCHSRSRAAENFAVLPNGRVERDVECEPRDGFDATNAVCQSAKPQAGLLFGSLCDLRSGMVISSILYARRQANVVMRG